MDFEKICMVFSMQEPYYGILLSSMKREPSNNTKTLAVGRTGSVFRLLYNPSFVESLPLDTAIECLKHEILHVAFYHFSLFEDIPNDPGIPYLKNVAADMEVNGYLNKNNFKGVSPVFASDIGMNDRMGAMTYFKELLKQANQKQKEEEQQEQQQESMSGVSSSQGGQQNNNASGNSPQPQSQDSFNDNSQSQQTQQDDSTPPPSGYSENVQKKMQEKYSSFDDHSQWPEMSKEEHEVLQEAVDNMLVFAAEEVEKGHGSIPGELSGRITNIRTKKKPKPVTDWKRFFRRYLGNEYSDLFKKSKKRLSKRFPNAAGNRHRRKSHILVGIDTSGSVSMPEYREFMGQLKTLYEAATFTIAECDTYIHHTYDFAGVIPEELHGGGGTDFQPVIDMFNKDSHKYDALVYFTDGYSTIPRDTPKQTLWVISSKGNKDRDRYKVNGATAVFIPESQK